MSSAPFFATKSPALVAQAAGMHFPNRCSKATAKKKHHKPTAVLLYNVKNYEPPRHIEPRSKSLKTKSCQSKPSPKASKLPA